MAKELVQTSASIGMAAWEYTHRQDMDTGNLVVLDIDGQRSLVFTTKDLSEIQHVVMGESPCVVGES